MRLSRGPEKRRGLHKMQRQFKRRRVFPFDLSKALFILPNAFTVSSICCGVYAILQCAAPEEGAIAFYRAALAIFFAGFFDMFDGRVARMTRTQSDFGVQMDSLADVISFGVAPAILVYTWALEPLGTGGKMIAFLYVSCGTIRLARFNVLAARGASSSRYFIGLPIPVAAAMLVSLVIAQYKSFGVPVQARNEILVLMVVLSYLMVSNVRYETMKYYKPSMKSLPYLVLVFAALLAITLFFRFSITLVTTIGFYIFYGLLAEVLFYSKRKQNDLAEKAKSAAQEVSPNEA
jgi:CDP-diacylglycerol---serine O-phosphatidyltransferase